MFFTSLRSYNNKAHPVDRWCRWRELWGRLWQEGSEARPEARGRGPPPHRTAEAGTGSTGTRGGRTPAREDRKWNKARLREKVSYFSTHWTELLCKYGNRKTNETVITFKDLQWIHSGQGIIFPVSTSLTATLTPSTIMTPNKTTFLRPTEFRLEKASLRIFQLAKLWSQYILREAAKGIPKP